VRAWLSACSAESDRLIDLARALVAAESPSRHRDALDACAGVLVGVLTEAGAAVRRHPAASPAADHVIAEWPGLSPGVLLVGHFDTVWPLGQIARQPLEQREGRLYGPGVYDMKAGLAIAITAARVVAAALPASARPAMTLLATSDEEVGSASSRALIEDLARRHAAVLVLEPAMAGGAIKTARKGVGEFELLAHGVSSHAGVDPGQGASAIHELAAQIIRIRALANPDAGLTVNIGVIDGGTRSNVVAESARALIDVRVARQTDVRVIEDALRNLRPEDPRVRLEVRGGINRPPMERTPGTARLFDLAREVAGEIGWDLQEGATGGASDGNFTAALGVPTLDGLGATGDGAHALHEHVIVAELPVRAALVAGLIARLSDNRVSGSQEESIR
jgi:glutamate carboxypeptidase